MPVGGISPNDYSGWGFVQADAALTAAGGPSSSSGGSSFGGSSKGGGGGFDVLSLMALAGLALARRRRVAEGPEIMVREHRSLEL
jgi:hypothetical protein